MTSFNLNYLPSRPYYHIKSHVAFGGDSIHNNTGVLQPEVGGGQRDVEEHGRESLTCHEQPLTRNLDFKDADGEGTETNEEHVTGNWREGDPCYVPAESLEKLSSGVMWKAEAISDKFRDILTEISKKSVVSASWFLLSVCSKMQEERDSLKEERF